jgi:hypothetical protein
MATFLSKLFKPKWHSKNKDIRLEAVDALDINLEADEVILLNIAENDVNLSVRSKVISKLNNSAQLIALHKKSKRESLLVIEQRLYELANAQSLTLFDLILDIKLLTEMIIKSDNPNAFILGLARIEDPEALYEIATSSKTTKIRQAAAELIESEPLLNRLLVLSKSKDKSVYQIVKAKLAKYKANHQAKEAIIESIEKLLQTIEEHARTESSKLYEAKFDSLISRWEPLKNSANTAQHHRFDIASAICAEKKQQLINEKNQHEENEKIIQTGGDEQEATLFTLSSTLNRFREVPASDSDISALDALIKTQETRWIEATRQVKVDKNQNKHYQLLMTELRQYFSSLKKFNDFKTDLEKLVTEAKSPSKDQKVFEQNANALKRILQQIDWPETYAVPTLLSNCKEALGYSAEVKQQFAETVKVIQTKVSQLIEKMDQALEDRQIKLSHKVHKDIQRLLSQMGPKQGESFHNQLTLRVKQLNELRDWQGYASSPRQQELCESMERLVERNMDPLDKSDQIKLMQKEWKQLGGASDQALWLRFKAASDNAYLPCQAFFDEQNVLKKSNIEKRTKLISQLDEFIQNNDWDHTDWKAVETINRQARLEWKEAFPVDFKVNKTLQNQFNNLLSEFDKRLNAERNRNIALKNEIIETAKALITYENLDEAINQAKALQHDWQKIGITPHKQDREIWKTYRDVCDQIFARRDEAKNQRKQEINASIEQSELYCNEVENFASSISTLTLEAMNLGLSEYRQKYKQLPSLPRNQVEQQQTRYEAALNIIKHAIGIQENKQVLLEWEEVQRKSTICRAYYANAQTGMEQNQSALDASFASKVKLSKLVETELKSLWISIKAGSLKNDTVVSIEQARSLCIGCEVAAGLDSPEQDKALRMKLQVNRLTMGMSSSNEHQSRETQLSELLLDWYQKVGPSLEEFASMQERVDIATNHLLGA